MKKIKVEINGVKKTVNAPVRLVDLVNDKKKEFICAKVNNQVQELSYELDNDAKVEYLTLSSPDATNTYRRSLCYLIVGAFYKLFKKSNIIFSYSISRAMYFEFLDSKSEITNEMIKKVDAEIRRYAKCDYKFEKINIPLSLFKKTCKGYGLIDKYEIAQYIKKDNINVYKCHNMYNTLYGRMLYSTGYIKEYKLIKAGRGVILQYPRAEEGGKLPKFEKAPAYLEALKSSDKWAKEMSCKSVPAINKKLGSEKGAIDFINECEARHSRMLVELGNAIENNINQLKIICIAGPSSSGKTTFANRLRVELLSRGIHPTMISLDNYYLPRNKIPKNEKGEPDFECLESLNVDLFNRQMVDLANNKSINMPIYKFGKSDKEEFKHLKQEGDKHIIIIEGIHALNDKLTSKIKRVNKYKIYISPQIQVNLDETNPLSLTDFRLIRRITRDYQFRDCPAIDTIKMWADVRAGEFKYIYKGIEGADYVFNSFSFYELCAYRKYTYPLLKKIKKDEPLYPVVERLMRMLKFFIPIDSKWIPCNALVREFIGGSCFE